MTKISPMDRRPSKGPLLPEDHHLGTAIQKKSFWGLIWHMIIWGLTKYLYS